MEENLREYIPLLPRETIRATMPQFFKDCYSGSTCIIDCSETPLQKCKNRDSRGESFSHYFAQNTIKYLVAIALCALDLFISSAYGGRCSDKYITSDPGVTLSKRWGHGWPGASQSVICYTRGRSNEQFQPINLKYTYTQLVFGSIAFKLFNLGQTFWVAFHKLPTMRWVNFGPFLLTELV